MMLENYSGYRMDHNHWLIDGELSVQRPMSGLGLPSTAAACVIGPLARFLIAESYGAARLSREWFISFSKRGKVPDDTIEAL